MLQVVRDGFEGGAEPEHPTAHLFLPMGPYGGTQVVGGRHESELLLAIKRHGPGRPARRLIGSLANLVGDLVIAQIDQTEPVGLHLIVQEGVLADHLHLVGQHGQNRAAAALAAGDDFDELLARGLEVLDLDQIVLHQLRPEQTVGAH